MEDFLKKVMNVVFYSICFSIIIVVIGITIKDIGPIIRDKNFAKFLLSIPTLFALIRLAFSTLGKISPTTRTRIKLFFKGMFVDTNVSVIAVMECDDFIEYQCFEKKLIKKLSDDKTFELSRSAKTESDSTDFVVYLGKTKIEFKTSYGDPDIRIKFTEISNRQYSIAKYIEKINKIITQAHLCMPDNTVSITTSIVYSKNNLVMKELLKNNASINVLYQDQQYILNSKRLEVKSSCSNQVDLVKNALIGNLIDD